MQILAERVGDQPAAEPAGSSMGVPLLDPELGQPPGQLEGAVLQLPQGACDVQEAIRRVEARLGAG